jgi:hypothetical protein
MPRKNATQELRDKLSQLGRYMRTDRINCFTDGELNEAVARVGDVFEKLRGELVMREGIEDAKLPSLLDEADMDDDAKAKALAILNGGQAATQKRRLVAARQIVETFREAGELVMPLPKAIEIAYLAKLNPVFGVDHDSPSDRSRLGIHLGNAFGPTGLRLTKAKSTSTGIRRYYLLDPSSSMNQ